MVKDIYKDEGGETTHTVKGLNTAASVWLSAAVGVACGGGLYFVATFTSALMLILLRFGPRTLVRQESILGTLLPEWHAPPPPPVSRRESLDGGSMTDVIGSSSSKTSKRKSLKKPSMYD